jgi:hypothetical protein
MDKTSLLNTIQAEEEDLNASGRFAWTESWPGFSLAAVIADNSYEHYQDHRQQIQRWLDAPKQDEDHRSR